jgi:ATP-grasp domain
MYCCSEQQQDFPSVELDLSINRRGLLMRVLTTSSRSPAGLELARIFAEHGYEVIVADSFYIGLCQFSSSVLQVIKVPAPNVNPELYAEALVDIIKDKSIDILVPCYEETFFVSMFKDQLEQHCMVFVDEICKLTTLHNKFKFIELCNQYGINAPETCLISSHDKLAKCIDEMDHDYILKPVYSRYSEAVISSANGDSHTDITINKNHQWVCQKFIKGTQYSVYGLAQKGKVKGIAIYPHRESRFKVSLVFSHVDSELIEKWVSYFIDKIAFSGNISFDLIIDNDGVIYPIECNPRITSGIHLFRDVEDFGAIFKFDNSSLIVRPQSPNCSVLSLLLLFDVRTLKELKHNLKIIRKSRDIFFERQDPLPVIGQLIVFFYILFLSLIYRMSLSKASMWDIEYNGDIK